MTDFDVAIIGAGVIGLACAAALAQEERSVLVVERHARAGQETSSRNSGVIHAGLYYPPGSLKALTCVEGRRALYARCREHGIAHRKTGKIVVATDAAEEATLAALLERGRQNDAGELRWLDARELTRLEPEVRGTAALLSPESGIVDVHELVYSYRRQARAGGAVFAFRTEVHALERGAGGWRLLTRAADGTEASTAAAVVVNAAGLASDRVASLAGLDIDALGYRLHWCKGDYFALDPRRRGLVQHLVYPVPVHAGLGIHLTFDLSSRIMFGPDTEYVSELSYVVSAEKRSAFGAAVRRYLPSVRDEELEPDFAGIRPKLQGPKDAVRDYVIAEASSHGAPGLVNLIGIESPGITASAAIAARVRALVQAS